MSNSSHYSESFLTEESEIPGSKLIENLRNEMESYKREFAGKIKFLQMKISDAEMTNEEYKREYKELENKVGELENKVETQELKIDHLEKMLDEKILENEIQKVTISGKKSPATILKAPRKIFVPKENFGLNENQLEGISKYGCLGHYLEDDETGNSKDGMNWTDQTCFALLVKAIKNGLTQFTLKFGARSNEFTVGNAKLIYSDEEIELENYGITKWIKQLSLTLDGRRVRFKASCQVMDALVGYGKKKYEFKETISDGLNMFFYEQVILSSDWEERGGWFTRYHVTIIN